MRLSPDAAKIAVRKVSYRPRQPPVQKVDFTSWPNCVICSGQDHWTADCWWGKIKGEELGLPPIGRSIATSVPDAGKTPGGNGSQ